MAWWDGAESRRSRRQWRCGLPAPVLSPLPPSPTRLQVLQTVKRGVGPVNRERLTCIDGEFSPPQRGGKLLRILRLWPDVACNRAWILDVQRPDNRAHVRMRSIHESGAATWAIVGRRSSSRGISSSGPSTMNRWFESTSAIASISRAIKRPHPARFKTYLAAKARSLARCTCRSPQRPTRYGSGRRLPAIPGRRPLANLVTARSRRSRRVQRVTPRRSSRPPCRNVHPALAVWSPRPARPLHRIVDSRRASHADPGQRRDHDC